MTSCQMALPRGRLTVRADIGSASSDTRALNDSSACGTGSAFVSEKAGEANPAVVVASVVDKTRKRGPSVGDSILQSVFNFCAVILDVVCSG